MKNITSLFYLFLFVVLMNLMPVNLLGGTSKVLTLNKGQLYLVFDPRLQGVGENCQLKLHQFKRHPFNPVLKPDKPWEGFVKNPNVAFSSNQGSVELPMVLWDPQEQIFKMWYLVFDGNAWVCYATSKDGIQWEKPNLGLRSYKDIKETNICFYGGWPGNIHLDLNAGDPKRRYVKWVQQYRNSEDGYKGDYSMYRFFSADGLRWQREKREPIMPLYTDGSKEPKRYMVTLPEHPMKLRLEGVGADGGEIFWFEPLKKFVYFYRVQPYNPNMPSSEPWSIKYKQTRAIARFESSDSFHWDVNGGTWAFIRDANDVAEHDRTIEFHSVTIHSIGDLFLAFTHLFHGDAGTIDIGFAYSTDTIVWKRPFRGQYVLPLAHSGEWDSGMIFPGPRLIEKDNLWWLYYGGSPYIHRPGKRYFAIGLAQMPIGRVVSARCWHDTPLKWYKEGSWTVGPVEPTGRHLLINAAIYNQLRAVILDEQDKPIPGFSSQIIKGNDIEIPVRWENGKDLSELAGSAVKIRFELNDAEIFGFMCR